MDPLLVGSFVSLLGNVDLVSSTQKVNETVCFT